MTVPTWVRETLQRQDATAEDILECQVLREGRFGKLAVVATPEKQFVVRQGLFSGEAFHVQFMGGNGATETPQRPQALETAVTETVEAEPATGPVEVPPALELVSGIGPKRATQLAELGVASLEALARAETEDLATGLGVGAATVAGWQAQADLSAIDGIGPKRSAALIEADLRTVEALVEADPTAVAERLDVPVERVEAWQAQADLTAVKGIGAKRAQALRRAGVPTVRALATTDPATLAQRLELPVETVQRWQEAALESAVDLTDLTTVKGIGPSRASRLLAAGVESVTDLQRADPETLAEAIEASPKTVQRWQDQLNGH